jgi:hypothetical protein
VNSNVSVSVGKSRLSTADISFYLFIGGAIAGLLQLIYPVDTGAEMFAIGKNIAEHGAFANPFYIAKTGATAVVPPLYPLFLAALIKLLKHSYLVSLAVTVANIAVNSLIAALLPRISLLFYEDAIPGAIGGIFWLCAAQLMPNWDASYTVAGLLLFCILTVSSVRRGDRAVLSGASTGLLAALLFLLNNSSILVSLPWIAYLLIRRVVPSRQRLAYCCTFVVVFCLIVSVWLLRNVHELGAPVLKTNFGMTLYASNNDCAEASLLDDEKNHCYQRHSPNISASEAQLLHSIGEVQYDRNRNADARNWIISHPLRFLQLTATRFGQFWFPPLDEHEFSTCIIWLVTVLSIPGLILMVRHREPTAMYMIAVLTVYPAMYYVVVSDVRYRYPVLWISLLSAGFCVRPLMEFAKAKMLYTAKISHSAATTCDGKWNL